MRSKRRILLPLYLLLCTAMLYSVWQFTESGAMAEEAAGTCCQVSSDCPGTKLCYLPGDKADCCRSGPGLPPCYGPNYCFQAPLND